MLLTIWICVIGLISCSSKSPSDKTGLVTPEQASPRQKPKVFRLLIMDSQSGEPYQSARLAFLDGLRSLGYIEGDNLTISYHSIENDLKKGEELLKQGIKYNYDVVITVGTVMTIAARNVALNERGCNFVFICVTDPVGIGVIEDFRSPPAHNFTGVCYPVQVRSRFQFIKELMPEAKTIGLIYADTPQSQSYKRWVRELLCNDPAFGDLRVIFRGVPLVTGEDGSKIMRDYP